MRCFFVFKSLTGEVQSQDASPLLVCERKAFTSHSSVNGHVGDQTPQEQVLNKCWSLAKGYSLGKSSYLIDPTQDLGCNAFLSKCKYTGTREYDRDPDELSISPYSEYREQQTWHKNMDWGRNPSTDKYGNSSAAFLAGLHCETLASINMADLGIQHATMPMVKVGCHPVRSNVGMFGDDVSEGKSHLNCSPSTIPSSFCQFSPEDPHLIADTAHYFYQNSFPLKGNEWHTEDERKYINLDHCNNEMFFNLFPLR